MMTVRVIGGKQLPGYRWWTVGAWRWGVKAGPVTVQTCRGLDVSVWNRWRVQIHVT